MIMDPYKVLGITSSASNEEVKKAYRELSRKYHPDSYVDNPLSGLAEEKFKEVQEAYDQIMKERENGYSSGNSGSYYSRDTNFTGSNEDTMELQAAFNYINSGYYKEALNTLSDIRHRNARWYYYSAVANAGIGNNVEAYNHAQQAVAMEPTNQEYNNFLNQIKWRSQRYQNTGYNQTGLGTGNLCCDLWCADSLCECMGGDLCSCC
ncbi:MAG: molecular chaperone DnaJ [Herbinix sp.]|jgi:molecular chaperone DnaJ|nr:molecular chaperone DnaJ [Herbinix sp.]